MSTKESVGDRRRMPVLFVGHGSPMNAIENNAFTQMLARLGQEIPRPEAILMILAHYWMSEGTWVLGMDRSKTIHDFYGFPQELFENQYLGSGSPELASLVQDTITDPTINNDLEMWGFDHGAWSIMRHMLAFAFLALLAPMAYRGQASDEERNLEG